MPPPTPAPQPTLPRAADASTTEVEPMTADVTLRHQMLLPLAGSLPTPPAAIVAVALAKAAAEAKAAVEAATATRSRLEEEARVVRKRPRPPSASPAAQRPYTRCQDGIAGGASLSSLQPLRPPPPPRSPPPSRLLHDQISGLAALAAPDAHEHALRQETAQAYAALVAGAIPGAQVYVFGSSATGLSLPDSDVDLGIVLPPAVDASTGACYPLRGREQHLGVLQRVQRSRQLGGATGLATIVELVRARVPVLKLRDLRSGLSVDLSVSSGDGHLNTQWLSGILAELPELRPLVVVLKVLLQQQGMRETFTGGVGSYLLYSSNGQRAL